MFRGRNVFARFDGGYRGCLWRGKKEMRVVGRSGFGYSGINFDVSKFATLSSMLGSVFLFVSKNGKWNSRFHFNDIVNLKRWNASNNEYVELFEMGLISQNNVEKLYHSVLLQYKKRSFKFLITTRMSN